MASYSIFTFFTNFMHWGYVTLKELNIASYPSHLEDSYLLKSKTDHSNLQENLFTIA